MTDATVTEFEEVECYECDKGFKDGEEIVGITGAVVSEAESAFIADAEPWLALFHKDCWVRISNTLGIGTEVETSAEETSDAGQPD